MPKTPSKMHMYDMMKIDTIVFEIVEGGGGGLKPPRIVSCLKHPGSESESQSEYLFNIIYAIFINNLNNMVIQ